MIDLNREYTQETERIQTARDLLWSSLPAVQPYGRFNLVPLSLRGWIDLRVTGNAFLSGTVPTSEDIEAYAWRNSVHFTASKNLISWMRKALIRRVVKNGNFLEMVIELHDHLRDAFEEAPHTADNGGISRTSGMQPVDSTTAAIDEIASRYGLAPVAVIDYPMARIFGLQKAIRQATVPDYKPVLPEAIRSLNSKILEELNNCNNG